MYFESLNSTFQIFDTIVSFNILAMANNSCSACSSITTFQYCGDDGDEDVPFDFHRAELSMGCSVCTLIVGRIVQYLDNKPAMLRCLRYEYAEITVKFTYSVPEGTRKLRFFFNQRDSLAKEIADVPNLQILHPCNLEIIDSTMPSAGPCLLTDRFDFLRIRSWMDVCKTDHSHVATTIQHTIDLDRLASAGLFRLIDVNTRQLIIVSNPVRVPFAALSYVWGFGGCSPPPFPDGESMADATSQSKPHRYSKTICDSIDFTKGIGILFLWVDQLCIHQQDTKEKTHVVSSMGAIYSRAELVICAAFGDHADIGLPGLTQGSRQREKLLASHVGCHGRRMGLCGCAAEHR